MNFNLREIVNYFLPEHIEKHKIALPGKDKYIALSTDAKADMTGQNGEHIHKMPMCFWHWSNIGNAFYDRNLKGESKEFTLKLTKPFRYKELIYIINHHTFDSLFRYLNSNLSHTEKDNYLKKYFLVWCGKHHFDKSHGKYFQDNMDDYEHTDDVDALDLVNIYCPINVVSVVNDVISPYMDSPNFQKDVYDLGSNAYFKKTNTKNVVFFPFSLILYAFEHAWNSNLPVYMKPSHEEKENEIKQTVEQFVKKYEVPSPTAARNREIIKRALSSQEKQLREVFNR